MATTTATVIPPANCSLNVLRFQIQSSDVIDEQARINVYEEKSENVIWYKERYLGDEEIVEHIIHNPTSTICWSIHRPKRGWYIRIRSRLFPPGVFIPFTPVPPASPHHCDAALSIHSRTNIPAESPTEISEAFTFQERSSSPHSYPPTPPPPRPPSLTVTPASPRSSTSTLEPRPAATQICEFIMTPSSAPPTKPENTSFLSRALTALMNHTPSNSNSFSLSRVSSAPPPYAAADPVPRSSLCAPLLVFHDRTPFLSFGSRMGTIEIDKAEERLVGIDTSFWIAVALTYLEFLAERESYLAAASD
ncbi:hypothetical protein BDZ89DRAFT_1137098 [Hymenopellis radicata]|nr:hypothetical protein BDZ89DRAFT_1137098 [Hymenopellis radicata]